MAVQFGRSREVDNIDYVCGTLICGDSINNKLGPLGVYGPVFRHLTQPNMRQIQVPDPPKPEKKNVAAAPVGTTLPF